ncbi:hypothetical protein [Hydrocarboniphaga effusa]|uniref:hypothetical protein n=1 Tax=Hydrocarboniphaga effusa TaxID=243629 RepID=UPI0012FC631E|nr:hypothetical protein [Hydrocarboniphaga effusa]
MLKMVKFLVIGFLGVSQPLSYAGDEVIPQSLRALPKGTPPYSYAYGPNLSGLSKKMEEAAAGQEWFDFFLLLQDDARYGVLSAGSDYWFTGRLDPQKIRWLPGPWGNEVLCPAPHCLLFGDMFTWLITADDNYKIIDYQLIFGREKNDATSMRGNIRVAFLESWIGSVQARPLEKNAKDSYLDFRTAGVFCSEYVDERPGGKVIHFIRKVDQSGKIISKVIPETDERGPPPCIYDGW